MLIIGLGEADICPTSPHPMAGFGLARTACHEGVHDPIAARCVVFQNGDERLALVSCEIIGLKKDLHDAIRRELPAAWNLPPERLLITCTHTHGGPVINDAYFPILRDGVLRAVEAALADRRPRQLAVGSTTHDEWVGFNRRHLTTGFLPVDREIPYLVIREENENLRAILFHYACHPSVLGPDNLFLTADWPGYTRRSLQSALGRDVSVLYLKGTEGDINTGYSAGISSLGIRIPTRTHATAERVGTILARSLLADLPRARPLSSPEIHFSHSRRALTYRDPAALSASKKNAERWESEVSRAQEENWPSDRLLSTREQAAFARFDTAALEEIHAAEVQERWTDQIAWRIGAVGFLSLPGEFFVESGLRIKRESVSDITFPLGITGDYLGYFPTEAAFAEGGYEVACARFHPSTADAWCTAGITALNRLFPHD